MSRTRLFCVGKHAFGTEGELAPRKFVDAPTVQLPIIVPADVEPAVDTAPHQATIDVTPAVAVIPDVAAPAPAPASVSEAVVVSHPTTDDEDPSTEKRDLA